jgi:hypothetical protein
MMYCEEVVNSIGLLARQHHHVHHTFVSLSAAANLHVDGGDLGPQHSVGTNLRNSWIA